MIILRAEETQTRPMQTGMGPAQYAGEGRAEAQAGAAVANVADRALQYVTSLDLQQQRIQATSRLKVIGSRFEDGINDFWYQWDKDYVQKGELPSQTLKVFEQYLNETEKTFYEETEKEYQSNQFLNQELTPLLSEVKKDAMLRARMYAYKSFGEIGRTKTKTALDDLERSALMADAQGNDALFQKRRKEIYDIIETQRVNGIFNDQDAETLLQERINSLTEKRSYQMVARDPESFLKRFHAGEFRELDPKLGKDLVVSAEQALARKVELKERERKLENESRKQYAITLKNELISKAMADPGAALADVLLMENRLALGDDFDNTVSTLRSLADPAKVHDDKTTLRDLSNEIERNPSPATYKNLDRALQNGKLSGSSYTSMTNRLTERIEKLKDRTERERHNRTNLAVSTYQPMLRVTGINDFDQISQGAQQLFEDELRFAVDQNKAADPMIEGRRLMIKYLDYVSDHAETFGEAVVQKYGFKSPAEVAQAYQAGKITRTEADVQIWYFSRQANKPKDSASSTSSNLVKKK